jgi:CBS domain-containing protein
MMQVREIMARLVHTIRAEASVEQASRHMRDENIGFLPVVEEGGLVEMNLSPDLVEKIGFLPAVEAAIVVGVLTDRDIVVRAIAAGKNPKTTAVSEIMTQHFAVCHEEDDLAEAAAVMEQHKVRRLIALNRQGCPVGILSIDDISAADTPLSGEASEAITM